MQVTDGQTIAYDVLGLIGVAVRLMTIISIILMTVISGLVVFSLLLGAYVPGAKILNESHEQDTDRHLPPQ